MKKFSWLLVSILLLSTVLVIAPSNKANAACSPVYTSYGEPKPIKVYSEEEPEDLDETLEDILSEIEADSVEEPFEKIADDYHSHIEDIESTTDASFMDTDLVDILCGKYPGGWTGVRNTAKQVPSKSKSMRMYEKKGGYKKAAKDFSKIAGVTKHSYNKQGQKIFYKISKEGTVSIYPKASSTGDPSLSFLRAGTSKPKEKIRYK